MVRIHHVNLCSDWWYIYGSRIVEWIFEFDFQSQENIISIDLMFCFGWV